MDELSEHEWKTFILTFLLVVYQPVGLFHSMWHRPANRKMWERVFNDSSVNVVPLDVIPVGFVVVHGLMWAAYFLVLKNALAYGDSYDMIHGLVFATVISAKGWGWVVFTLHVRGRWLVMSLVTSTMACAALVSMFMYLPRFKHYMVWLWFPVVLWYCIMTIQGIGLTFPVTRVESEKKKQ